MKKFLLTVLFLNLFFNSGYSQINQDKTGAWYMYFFNHTFQDGPWGVQGDIQYRNWNAGGDLEQLLLRGGLTYKPKQANLKFTLGYGHIITGVYGSDNSTTSENRIYQEALLPLKIGGRFYLNHRFRFEQRFVDNQDFRTRYRYNLFINVPLNNAEMTEKTLYLALYNEIFLNGERSTGNGNTVEIFDRNRSYAALGWVIKNNLNLQMGIMRQVTDSWAKSQAQVSLHHKWNP